MNRAEVERQEEERVKALLLEQGWCDQQIRLEDELAALLVELDNKRTALFLVRTQIPGSKCPWCDESECLDAGECLNTD